MSCGEEAVGASFNPSGDDRVSIIKMHFAAIIDLLHADREGHRDERARVASVAITEAQTAQMWAVKAITHKREE